MAMPMMLDDLEDALERDKRILAKLLEGKPANMSWKRYKLECQVTANGLRHLREYIEQHGVRVHLGGNVTRTFIGSRVTAL